MPASNIGQFVAIYDDAPGALRMLCDALLHEWLQSPSAPHVGGGDAATRELQLLFHHLLDLLLDPDRNACALIASLSPPTHLRRAEALCMPVP